MNMTVADINGRLKPRHFKVLAIFEAVMPINTNSFDIHDPHTSWKSLVVMGFSGDEVGVFYARINFRLGLSRDKLCC
jgi:hypothetical protein